MGNSLYWLALTVLVTAMMWLPYVLNSFLRRGLMPTMGYADDVPPLAPWANRAKKAHYNAVENLVLFGPLVVALATLSKTGEGVAVAAMVYFFSRVAHYLVYAAKVPVLRTLTFTGGWGAIVYLSIQLLQALGTAA